MASFRTATEFVIAVENTLGWVAEATPTKPLYKVRSVEAGKINQKRNQDLELYSWENLETALLWCQENRVAVKAPVSVLYKVPMALAGRPPEERPISVKPINNDGSVR